MKNEQKEIDKDLKLLAKSSIIVFAGIFFAKIFNYVYRIIIARNFGPEVYGLFSLAIMILGFFVAFSSLGLSEGLLRYISLYRGKKERQKIRYLFKFSLTISFFLSMISGIILFFFSEFISINFFHNTDLIIFLKIFSFVIPLYVISNIFLSVIRAFEKISWYSFIDNILLNAIKVISLIFLLVLGFKTSAIIFSYVLGFLIVLITSFLLCKYGFPEIFKKYKLKEQEAVKIKNKILSYSWPIMFVGLIGNIFYWTDSFFIGYLKSVFEVGLYNAAVPIALLLLIAPSLFITLFFPLIIKQYSAKNFKTIQETSKQIVKWIFMINLPIFIFLILFPGVFINILFGGNYLAAENSLRILAIGAFVSSIFIISSKLILVAGKSRLLLKDLFFIALVNIILNYLLIPMKQIFFIENSLGINGAAIATMISYISLNILFAFQTKHYFSFIPLRRKMIKIGAISIIPLLLLICARELVIINIISIILLTFLFITSYTLLIFLTKCLDKNDFMILRSIKRKIYPQ